MSDTSEIPVMVNTIREDDEPKRKYGLVDGGTIQLECSVCSKPLMDITVTRPGFKFSDGTELVGDYMAKCPYCGNYSKKHNIKGGIATTNLSKIDDQGHETMVTYMKDFDINQDGVTIFNVQIFKKK